MAQKDPETLFDQAHASQYDERFVKLEPLREALLVLASAALQALPEQAHLLCVGAGTGAEILGLSRRFPQWRFTAVEPSGPMLEVCRQRTEALAREGRCDYVHGYVSDLPAEPRFDGATAILVSHFILDPVARAGFYRSIAERLKPGAVYVAADLATDTGAATYEALLELWFRMMVGADLSDERINEFRRAYQHDVALLPPEKVAEMMAASGFSAPVPFFQAGLIRAWSARVLK